MEVTQMDEAQVHAYGEGDTAVVECTVCGPLAVVSNDSNAVSDYAFSHLRDHYFEAVTK